MIAAILITGGIALVWVGQRGYRIHRQAANRFRPFADTHPAAAMAVEMADGEANTSLLFLGGGVLWIAVGIGAAIGLV